MAGQLLRGFAHGESRQQPALSASQDDERLLTKEVRRRIRPPESERDFGLVHRDIQRRELGIAGDYFLRRDSSLGPGQLVVWLWRIGMHMGLSGERGRAETISWRRILREDGVFGRVRSAGSWGVG